MRCISSIFISLAFAWLSACAAPASDHAAEDFQTLGNSLSRGQRADRLERVRDVAASAGLTNGWLLGGIVSAEGGLAHCWSEATWACKGPWSDECAGPVIAGKGDGPCYRQQGGLGLFQFDGGNFDDTLERDGAQVLSIDGSVRHAVEFVVDMVIRSRFISGVDTHQQALAWMNNVRPQTEAYRAWIRTVTGYYNGCLPEYCANYATQYSIYDRQHQRVLQEMGANFWFDNGHSSEAQVMIAECNVPSHLGVGTTGDHCSQPGAWRCAYSFEAEAWTGQVCRAGAWFIYSRNPDGCADCCGTYSSACR